MLLFGVSTSLSLLTTCTDGSTVYCWLTGNTYEEMDRNDDEGGDLFKALGRLNLRDAHFYGGYGHLFKDSRLKGEDLRGLTRDQLYVILVEIGLKEHEASGVANDVKHAKELEADEDAREDISEEEEPRYEQPRYEVQYMSGYMSGKKRSRTS